MSFYQIKGNKVYLHITPFKYKDIYFKETHWSEQNIPTWQSLKNLQKKRQKMCLPQDIIQFLFGEVCGF